MQLPSRTGVVWLREGFLSRVEYASDCPIVTRIPHKRKKAWVSGGDGGEFYKLKKQVQNCLLRNSGSQARKDTPSGNGI